MEKINFEEKKEQLLTLLQAYYNQKLDPYEKEWLETTITILQRYTFENRLHIEGSLTRAVLDGSISNQSLRTAIMDFDEMAAKKNI